MDWKKIKTILICSLIAINAILGFTIYKDYLVVESSTSIDRSLIKRLFDKRGIVIDDNIYNVNQVIKNVELSLITYNIKRYEPIFQEYKSEEIISGEVTIREGKQLTYVTKYNDLTEILFDDDTIIKQGDELIGKLGFDKEEILLNEIKRTNKKVTLVYIQRINGYSLLDSYIEISFNDSNLLSFKRLWYNVDSISYDTEKIESPEYVLYKFTGMEYSRWPNRIKDVIIEKFELVYSFRTKDLSNGYKDTIMKGEPLVYWMIETSNDLGGDPYLINANEN